MIRSLRNARPFTVRVLALAVASGIAALPVFAHGVQDQPSTQMPEPPQLFKRTCALCHGADARGTGKKPSLRSVRVQKEATEGDLAWLLKNGNLGRGMPTWSSIPEPSRWEIIAYVRSLGPVDAAANGNSSQEKKQ